MKFEHSLALLLLALSAGCVSKENIVFSDEAEIGAIHAQWSGETLHNRLDKADAAKIEQVVFCYLLEQHLADVSDYPAVFLQTDDALVDALIKKYPNHLPPIKPGSQALIQAHQAPLDKESNKPAMVLSVEVTEPNADDTVDAAGRWRVGDSVSGFRVIRLKKSNGEWVITTVK